jgi:hypothetical protein
VAAVVAHPVVAVVAEEAGAPAEEAVEATPQPAVVAKVLEAPLVQEVLVVVQEV